MATTDDSSYEDFKATGGNHLLPRELRHRDIRLVRRTRWPEYDTFQIVFDRTALPSKYTPLPDDWEITYARIEYHKPSYMSGWLARLVPSDACITIVVKER